MHSGPTVLRLKAKDGKTAEDVAKVVKNLKPELTSSTNIGLADFYPATSGKEKAAQHIVEKFNSRLEEAFLLCDDDNDMGELHLHTDTSYCHHHPGCLLDACNSSCYSANNDCVWLCLPHNDISIAGPHSRAGPRCS